MKLEEQDYEIISKSDFDSSPNLTVDTTADKKYDTANSSGREFNEFAGRYHKYVLCILLHLCMYTIVCMDATICTI